VSLAGAPAAVREKQITKLLQNLRKACGVHEGLAARGVNASTIADLAPPASRDACLFTNPRRASLADIKTIYAEAL